METTAETRTRKSQYYQFVPFGILVAVYLPVLYDLSLDWYRDANYSHGFLVPLVSGYLLWKDRARLAGLPRIQSTWGLPIIILGMALLVLGTCATEYFTVRLSFVITLFGLVYYLYGRDLAKQSWFAFFFLLFMIPIPYIIYYAATFPMQTLATKITVATLNIIGAEAVRQGNIIHLQGHSLEVAEACSGIRSLVSLLALGALFAYLTQKRFAAQLVLLVSTIPIAVIANVARVLLTALLVSTIDVEVTSEPWHSVMAMSVFVFSFICLSTLGLLLKRIFQ